MHQGDNDEPFPDHQEIFKQNLMEDCLTDDEIPDTVTRELDNFEAVELPVVGCVYKIQCRILTVPAVQKLPKIDTLCQKICLAAEYTISGSLEPRYPKKEARSIFGLYNLLKQRHGHNLALFMHYRILKNVNKQRHLTSVKPWLTSILENDEELLPDIEIDQNLSELESEPSCIKLTRLEEHHDRTLDKLYPKLRFSIKYERPQYLINIACQFISY